MSGRDKPNPLDLAITTPVERECEFQRRECLATVPFYQYDLDRASADDIAVGCSRGDLIDLALEHCKEHSPKDVSYPENAIYVIEAGGRCKIGVSRDPGRRAKAIQGANWQKVKIGALFWTDERSVYEFEEFCHATASRAGIERRLEWVASTPKQTVLLVAKCAQAWRLRIADSGMWLVHRQLVENAARNFLDSGTFGRLTERPI